MINGGIYRWKCQTLVAGVAVQAASAAHTVHDWTGHVHGGA
jgi:hypothetical protein